jgi:3-deoxy-D-manno-octulosonic-acid transferase
MVAGSTHPGEHEIVLSAFNTAKKRFPDLRLVLAPRHLEKTAAVESALRASGVMYSRWSQPRTDSECLLLDAMGLLRAFYGEATLAFVGGSLAAVGGHNLLEPALAGTPVFFGPHTENARQAAELLISSGCGFVVKNEAELGEGICAALGDPRRIEELRSAVKAMSATLRGATERTLAWLGPVISPTPRLYNCPSGQ